MESCNKNPTFIYKKNSSDAMSFSDAFLSVIIVVLSAIPLNLAIKLLGGETNLFRVLYVNFFIAVISVLLSIYVESLAGVLSFFALLFLYKVMYDLSWLRALLAWCLQFVIIFVFFYFLDKIGMHLPFF